MSLSFVSNIEGRVISASGSVVEAELPLAELGARCTIERRGGEALLGRVTALRANTCLITPLDPPTGVASGAAVRTNGSEFFVEVPVHRQGAFSCLGNPLLSEAAHQQTMRVYPFANLSNLEQRAAVEQPMPTGIRSIDCFTPVARGQRLALMAGPGMGKTTLLKQIAEYCEVDHIVLALVGERGREAAEFIHGYAESERDYSIICATSDESPMRRMLAPYTATALAEELKSQGKHVLLIVDSLTRCARAMREVTLAAGEPPIRQGFTPSVYAELPRLLERPGNFEQGSITAIYSLLKEGMEELDPLSHELKSLLDGHIMLSDEIRSLGVYPCIDPRDSISRCNNELRDMEAQAIQMGLLKELRELLEKKEQSLFSPESYNETMQIKEKMLCQFLAQQMKERSTVEETLNFASQLLSALNNS